MFKIITAPEFNDSLDPNDPIHSIPLEVAKTSGELLARQTDEFVRKCVAKVLSDSSLSLFIDSNSAVPGLDLILELKTYAIRKMTVMWKDTELGHATFTTKITKTEDGYIVTHESSDVFI